jgi:protein-arginine kinase activator protein McsA
MPQEQLSGAGRLGCPACVQTFKRKFLLARKRRGLPAGYAGKVPRGFSTLSAGLETGLDPETAPEAGQDSLLLHGALESSRLLADIESAILSEDFEKAALLRDRLGSVRIKGNADNDA